MYSPGDAGFANAKQSGNLPEAAAVLKVHLHHDFRSAFEQIQPVNPINSREFVSFLFLSQIRHLNN